VTWTTSATGFSFNGLSKAAAQDLEKQSHWLSPDVRTEKDTKLTLGPEPMIAAQSVTLVLKTYRLRLRTDGLGPFMVAPDDGEARMPIGTAP
jgi:general secretion pathway protein H